MAEQGQSPALYLGGPEESVRRRMAVPGSVAWCLLVAAVLGLIAAGHTAGAATSRVGTDSSAAVITESGPQLASSDEILPAREWHPAVRAHTTAATAISTAAPPVRARRAASNETTPGFGCSFALAWLAGHAAPGFRFECPGYALGHQAMTCADVAGICPGARLIVISDPCPAAYMNEANNSWIVVGLRSGRLDPYGYCR